MDQRPDFDNGQEITNDEKLGLVEIKMSGFFGMQIISHIQGPEVFSRNPWTA